MDVLLSQLKAAKTGDEIEAAISSSSSLNLQIESEKDTLKAELERILEDGSVETTAKLRRRISRFKQSLDVTTTRTSSQPSNENLPTQIVLIKHSNPGDSISALSVCKNYHDLQREMNCLCLPSEEQGGINGEYFSEYRNPMKEVLKGLVAQAGMTNIVLRRRITRLIFVLSNDAEKKEEVAAVKAKAVIAATRNLTPKAPKKERVPFDNKIEPIAPPEAVVHVMSKFEAAKHIADCISGIRSAKTPGDVEKTISALPASGFGDSACLRELLEGILDNTELVNNSKVRRRVKRLIETLSSSSSSSDIVKVEPQIESESTESISKPINEVPSSSAAKAVKSKVAVVKPIAVVIPKVIAPPLKIPSVAVAPPLPPVRIITGSFVDSLKRLSTVSNANEVEEAISDLSVESNGSGEEKEAVRLRLEELFKDEEMINNSKLRRRVKRLLDTLAPAVVIVPEVVVKKEKKIKVKVPKEDLKNPPPGPPLEGVISQVGSIHTVQELSNILGDVNEKSGTCGSRRTLKRALERVMKEDSALSGDFSDESRMKMQKILDMLAPQPSDNKKRVKIEPVSVIKDEPGSKKKKRKKDDGS